MQSIIARDPVPSPLYSGERVRVRGSSRTGAEFSPAQAPHPRPLPWVQGRGSALLLIVAMFFIRSAARAQQTPSAPDQWRSEKRLIDMHMHVDPTPEHMARAVKIMDAAGIGIAVNLGVGTVTPGKDGTPSQLEQAKKLADQNHPGRFLQHLILD